MVAKIGVIAMLVGGLCIFYGRVFHDVESFRYGMYALLLGLLAVVFYFVAWSFRR